ncbi:DUF6458 family protein [Nocardioides jishulii]|uniref:DUF6458 domain-containing protein n=1 Tax=Nocardioides jishulii TaxID=2575440 RepID=A0A4U2YR34_9ACTN|nr:DUF6458 family protein [Nocardioides jishulii]QCX26300.1 hypothetical protein FCL41_01140 [Nocardioides jishulii]TKI63896.1 hypothetical protein FC770_01565 [Nocardioides jishulii]
MGLGLGIVLIVLGLIFGLGVVNIPGLDQYVATETLGWILVAAGVLSIVLGLVMNKQRGETRHVEERHVDSRRDVV